MDVWNNEKEVWKAWQYTQKGRGSISKNNGEMTLEDAS